MIMRWIALAILPVVSTPACVPVSEIVQQDHTQSVTIFTEPPGATVWQRVEGDAIELGEAPVTIQGGFSVLSRRTDKGSCALAGAGEGLALGDEVGGDAGAVVGLVGLFVGAAVATQACKEADGPIETQGGEVVLVATLPGFLSERHVIHFPRSLSQVTLRLIPDPNSPVAAAAPAPGAPTARQPPQPANARGPAVASPASEQPLGEPTLRPGLAIYPVQVEVRGAEPVPDLSADLTETLAAALDRSGLVGNEPDTGPGLLLDTRLLAIGDLCVLSATLRREGDHQTQKVATARSTCDRSAVDAAIGRLAAQLASPEALTAAAQ